MRKRMSTAKKAAREVFLVMCEGETEKEYVEMLKRQYRLPIFIRTKITRTNINQRLVSQYLKELDIEKDDGYQVFYIYDADVDCIVDKLRRLDGMLILSNPCIELWFILHVKDYRKEMDSAGIVDELRSSHQTWAKYSKGKFSEEQAKCLNDCRCEAMERARTLKSPANPSSDMFKFIDELERVSKCQKAQKLT